MVTGCLLCAGGSPASAQPLAAIAPLGAAHVGNAGHAGGHLTARPEVRIPSGVPAPSPEASPHPAPHPSIYVSAHAPSSPSPQPLAHTWSQVAPGPAAPAGSTGHAGPSSVQAPHREPTGGHSQKATGGHGEKAAGGHGQKATGGHNAHSLRVPAAGRQTRRLTPGTSAGGRASRAARFTAKAVPTGTGGTATTQTAHQIRGDARGQGKTQFNKSSKAKGNPNGNGGSKGGANSKSGAPATPARRVGTSLGGTVAHTVTVPLPRQRPARPERFSTIPLVVLSPVPAAGGPLPGTPLTLAPLTLAPVRRAGSALLHLGESVLPRGWAGESLKESDKLKLPIALMAAIAVFMLVQALVDRRDPKLSDAPERPTDDSLEFE